MQFTELGDIYQTKHKIRIISATSLFDGHDASINMIRRILQDSGVEVIHLGHNRSVKDIVNAAIQENVQGVTISSYQGGHIEFFKYMRDLLNENGYEHVKIFGGGGGVIIPDEIAELHEYGISRIFSPDDGREMGPQGMINYILKECDFPPKSKNYLKSNFTAVSNSISLIEESILEGKKIDVEPAEEVNSLIPVLGITGTGGAGKSSLTDELVRRFVNDFNTRRVAILSVDPTKRKTGGALLADRIRMNSLTYSDRIFMRSFATRRANVATSKAISQAINICKKENFDLIIVETSGIGQSDTEIIDLTDCSIYVMTADYGAATQLEKIDMIDYADFIVINKFERRGSIDALRDVRKQYRRGRKLFDFNQNPDETLPIFGTMASQFNDAGVNSLYLALMAFLNEKYGGFESQLSNLQDLPTGNSNRQFIVPPERVRYLAEIAETVENYKEEVYQQAEFSRKVWQLSSSRELLFDAFDEKNISIIDGKISELKQQITEENQRLLDDWDDLVSAYQSDEFSYSVRGKTIVVPTFSTSLSNIKIPLICLPRFKDMGEILQWIKLENVPGEFPYTAGVFPFKRTEEDPTRMFAGEGPPERTNKRFHYLSKDHKAVRLSTAFDSVTLYGEDPHERPDIYGKIGTSGVSICSVEDMERLYAGFDLSSNVTSVSMTING
ncbi:MAG: methylmalonyl-CoA mutase family protein, partial [Candidatus Heimdallarchaeota archaeon]|nr:methylmalonyl-CoA mutase family protein [Candidatus Heimdallarchaeota archaeon]